MSMYWPWPVCVAVVQGRQDADGRVDAGDDVGDGDADLLRRAVAARR